MSQPKVAIEIRGITKRFGNILANNQVSLEILQGEIHALVGENGAGKTTLMNILYGIVKPDSGEILLRSKPLPTRHGFIGIDYGIGMIHQNFMLIGAFTALENIILGNEPKRGGLIDKTLARHRIVELMKEYGIQVDLDRRVDSLSVGEQQRVEILKVLYRDAQIIIMDEPTSVLAPQEIRNLFATIKMLASSGKTIIFISHKLEEVMGLAQRVTVMRAGSVVGTRDVDEVDPGELAVMMVGQRIESQRGIKSKPSDQVVLGVENLCLQSRTRPLLSDICFWIRRGEIFGICGVEGNGQDELVEVLIGLRRADLGSIYFEAREISHLPLWRRLSLGIGLIPSDRAKMGTVEGLSVAKNLVLGRHRDPCFSKRGFLKTKEIRSHALGLISDFRIEPKDWQVPIDSLSGGNQQKVVVARELSKRPRLLLACNPTRGLDISATSQIHDLISDYAARGGAVLLVSADLSEVIKLSQRIGVMYRGRLVGILDAEDADEEKLGFMMMGLSR